MTNDCLPSYEAMKTILEKNIEGLSNSGFEWEASGMLIALFDLVCGLTDEPVESLEEYLRWRKS